MRQFTLIAWKGDQPHARVGKKFVPLDDAALGYDALKAQFHDLTKDGVSDDFESLELFALSGAEKARKFITRAERDRRAEALAAQTKPAEEKPVEPKSAAQTKPAEEKPKKRS